MRRASLSVANRRRRHERRSHLQLQVRDGDACPEWLPIAFPFAWDREFESVFLRRRVGSKPVPTSVLAHRLDEQEVVNWRGLDADHPENGVLTPCLFTPKPDRFPVVVAAFRHVVSPSGRDDLSIGTGFADQQICGSPYVAVGDQTVSAASFLIKVVAADKRRRAFRVVLRHQHEGLFVPQLKRARPHIVADLTLLERLASLSFKRSLCQVKTGVHPYREADSHAHASR